MLFHTSIQCYFIDKHTNYCMPALPRMILNLSDHCLILTFPKTLSIGEHTAEFLMFETIQTAADILIRPSNTYSFSGAQAMCLSRNNIVPMFGSCQKLQHPVRGEQQVSSIANGHVASQEVVWDVVGADEQVDVVWVAGLHSSSLPIGPTCKVFRVRQAHASRGLPQRLLHNRRRRNEQLILGLLLHLIKHCDFLHL